MFCVLVCVLIIQIIVNSFPSIKRVLSVYKCTEKMWYLFWVGQRAPTSSVHYTFQPCHPRIQKTRCAINGGGLFMFTSWSNALMVKTFHDVYLVLNVWKQELNWVTVAPMVNTRRWPHCHRLHGRRTNLCWFILHFKHKTRVTWGNNDGLFIDRILLS